ncbi:hypothetical protein LWF01_02405 [Saxibacter everestensis]|uniref:Uncharacterized protein n=1 Tax=Saxibacter everestensis TaxID=2909229 RepID=A0ABY8QWP8_9MICO|nr:hypothetical protein LWF01_02405 [Brevibacteriaceae bacterium ZFBP1038]
MNIPTDLGRPGEQIALGRPPFGFQVSPQPGWQLMPPGGDELRNAAKDYIFGQAFGNYSTAQKASILEAIRDVGSLSKSMGAVANLIHSTPQDSHDAVRISSIVFSWVKSAPMLADLDLAKVIIGDGDMLEEIALPVGPAMIKGEVTRLGSSASGDGEIYTVQVVAPVPGSLWFAMFTGIAFSEDQVEHLEEGVRQTAATLVTTHENRFAE